MTTPSLGKTKKLKKSKNNQELWTLFNSEIPDQTKEPLECVYRSSGQRENCDLCSSSLAITEEGFLACTKSYVDRYTQICLIKALNGGIMALMTTSHRILHDAVCLSILANRVVVWL